MNFFHSSKHHIFPFLVVLMRISFGGGWLLAGITKITDKGWFRQPSVFLQDYLETAVTKPNVPEFYKDFIKHLCLPYVDLYNYVIPCVQIVIGILLIVGLFTLPSIFICLFMHINFILSGNMNLLSLVLYTSAFGLLLCGSHTYSLSLDGLFKRVPSFAQKPKSPSDNLTLNNRSFVN
ncbi:DoxX family membrane protein [Brevibacillus laterosporus]|uniref:DoxX family membrane protein n=1 Tax=Brevibacillus laterosporus TaxID=1465 RepID=A0A502H757_BRELA|nr:DoxX family membrane protein [Brevibacillus laterosporus]QDX92232.1 DoxX family membrane protein [Brevibacillus laterosporus]TPG70539.1 DoxX family membrane protein [Brevibacillus laterosporus]TPG85634.1 DoxX family membrane protein [Brevibacillus laterosporus]